MKPLLFVLCFVSLSFAMTPEFICDQLLPSCVQVEIHEGGRCSGGGSAICIYKGEQVNLSSGQNQFVYLFITAAHVIDINDPLLYTIRVFEYDQYGRRLGQHLVQHNVRDTFVTLLSNSLTDNGLIEVVTNKDLPITTSKLLPEKELEKLMVGQEVWALGSPLLTAPIIAKGFIAQLNISECVFDDFPWAVDIISVDGDHGDSGGGIFTDEGELIGTISLGFTRDSHSFVLGSVNVKGFYNLIRETRYAMLFKDIMDVPESVQEEIIGDPESYYPSSSDGQVIKPLQQQKEAK